MMKYSLLLAVLASICCSVLAASSCGLVSQKIFEAAAVSGTNLNVLSRVPGGVYFHAGSTPNVTFVVQLSSSVDLEDPVSISLVEAEGLSLLISANTREISGATSRQSMVTLFLNLTLAALLPATVFINKSSFRWAFAVLLLCSLAVRVNTAEESCIRADIHIFVPEQFAFGEISMSLSPESQVFCPNDCSASGICDRLTGQCTCKAGYSGQDCSVVSMEIQAEDSDAKRSVMEAEVTVKPSALSTIQANPYRGFYNWLGMDYSVISQSVGPYKDSYMRYAWKELETSQGVYNYAPIDTELTKAATNGGKFGFRIMILDTWAKGVGLPNYIYQSQGGAMNCDADGNGALDTFVPNWEDTFMRQRAQALFNALSTRYNNDARLGWIDIGMIGDYGEWHASTVCTNDPGASLTTKQAYIDIVVNAFPNKYFTINTNDDDGICYALQKSQKVGIRNDIFSEIWNWDNSRFWPLGQYRYRTAPSFAEFTASGNPATYNFAEAQREARDYHFSTVGNGNIPYTSSGYTSQQLADLAELGRIIGFVAKVNSVQLSTKVDQGNCLVVGLNMSNTGTSRIYDDWNTVIELRPTCAKYVGCWTDVSSSRDLTGSLTTSAAMTIDSCSASCKSAGYKYAGIQSGNTCTCGNSYGKYAKQAETQCATACVGDATQRCGGSLRNSVYDVSACTGSFVTSTTTYRSPNVMEITNVFPDVPSYTGTNSFNLASGSVPVGLYKAYLAVLDRNGYRPPLALAITGRDANGRYPLGVSVLVTNTSSPGVTITCPTTTPVFNQPLYPVTSYRYQQTAAEYFVFRDNFAVGWGVDRPYQITSALKLKESTSLKMTSVTDTWYVMNFFACDLVVSKYANVRISIYAEKAVSGLQLQMYKGQWSSSLPAVWLGSLAAGTWQTFTVPLSQFSSPTRVTWIVLAVQQPAQTNAIYIDDFAFATTNYQYIFRDTLCSGCTVSTIPAVTWTANTAIVNSEANSMKLAAITATWYIIDITGMTVPTSWQYLHLEVYVEKDVTLAQVQLYSGTWNNNIPAVVIPVTAGKWNTFNIPVSQFALTGPATILSIQIGQNSGQTNNYYLDNVVFSNDGTL